MERQATRGEAWLGTARRGRQGGASSGEARCGEAGMAWQGVARQGRREGKVWRVK